MNNQIECLVKETPGELSYRKEFYPNAKSIKTDDLSCTVCNEDLIVSKKLLNHPILGILMCKKCYEKNKSPDKKKCMLCFGSGKKLIECKNKKCSYLTCEECVSRINPKAKSFHKPGKWNCFACNITPLYKLRGISSAAMSSSSTEKSSNQPNKRIKKNTISKSKDKISRPVAETQKINGQNLSRCDSTSSSGTEFTKTKIIDTNLSSSRINHHDLSDISDNDAQEDDALTKRQLFELKHNIKKLFDSMKEMGTKMLRDVEKLQQNFYTNKHKYKSSDVRNIMSECTSMIQSVQDCTSTQEKKLIERHKTWCRKSKFKNTLAMDSRKFKKNQDPVKESDDEKRASTPVEKNSKFVLEKSSSRLEVSDCDEQIFSDDDADKNDRDKVGDDVEVDDLNQSKDLFSDDDLVADNHVDDTDVELTVERSPSKSSRKSSDESDDGNEVRKKRLLKVKKKSGKIDSDDSTDSNGKERRLSRSKSDKMEKKSDGVGAEGRKSSESDDGRSGDKENEKNDKESDDIVLTPESRVKKLSYEVDTDKDEDKEDERKEKRAKESLLKSSDSELTEVDTEGKKTDEKSGSDLESEQEDDGKKNGKDKKLKSGSVENDRDGKKKEEAKKVLNSAESGEDDDKIKKRKEEEAKKILLNSSSDSEEENEGKKKNEDKNSRSNSAEDDSEDDKKRKKEEEAKKALMISSSDSDDDEKIKKRKEEEAKRILINSSSDSEEEINKKKSEDKKSRSSSLESDHGDDKSKKRRKEEEAKKALLISSSDSDHDDDEKIKKQKEEAKKITISSSDSDREEESESKKQKEEEAKKALLNSSSDSDHEDDEKSKKQKEDEGKKITISSSSESDDEKESKSKKQKEEEAKKALLNSSSDSDHEDDEKLKKQKEDEGKKISISSSSESDHEEEKKSKKEEEAKKALLNSSSDSDHEDDEKLKKRKEDEGKKISISSSSESDHEEEKKSKKEEEAKKALLNSSSDSDHEDDEKLKKRKEDEGKKISISPSSESDEEVNSKRITRRAAEAKKIANEVEKESDSDIETISSKNSSTTKSKRFQLNNNIHYNNDKKLKLKSLVKLERLSKRILSRHSKALRLSREYLENKKVLSLMSLDGLEKKNKKKHRSDSSTDEDSKHSRSRKKTKISTDDDTLLDHLKKVETGNGDNDSSNSSMEDDVSSKNNKNKELEPQSLVQQADKVAKASILADSESSDVEETPMEFSVGSQDKKKETEKNKRNDKSDQDDDKKSKKNKGDDWKRSKLLTGKILDSDSDEENEKAQKKLSQRSKNDSDSKEEADDSIKPKKKSTRTRRRRLNSDSDIKISDDSDSTVNKNDKDDDYSDDLKKSKIKKTSKRKNKSDSSDSSSSLVSKKSKTKRRRIRAVAEDSEDSSDDDDLFGSQGGANKSGRKNIRKVLKDKHVADGTLQAAKQEEERIRRMAERQKLYNEMYEARLASEAKVDKLVLDFDAETKEVLLEVDENLVKRLKPHQAKGIKFMWDACFESLERTKRSEGSGCILAHCMGLGKSFQVVTLSHTLLMHSEKTGINKILIVVPLSTVLNWMNEFKIWLSEVENGNDIEMYEMTKAKTNIERKCHLENWQRTGGVLIIGYEMFRNLCAIKGKVRKSVQEAILKCILDPGPDLIICDEGHLLKNEDSAISKAIRRVKTLRRIVLTGTPLQNNLIEYHCMVQFVKPNLLGTKKEFSNRFVNPIQNGQFDDSTEYDVKLMKKRAHVLHKMLEGSVQRFDYSVLTPFLPPKQEYVISIRLSDVQVKLYQYYIDNFARKHKGVGGSLFADFQALSRLWTHPFVVKLHTENSERLQQKKRDAESDSEGSLKDFIDDGSDTVSSSSESSDNTSNESDVIALDDEDGKKKNKKKGPPPKRGTRANPVAEEIPAEPEEPTVENRQWWTEFIKDEDFDDMRLSAKLIILFDIIKEAEAIGDKVLVFSQSLYSLTLIEKFLSMIDDETQNGRELETLDKHTGCWVIGQDYFRFDGQTSAENRSHWVKSFNRPSNTRARLFLISTRAGGLGINLTAANRVVIFDASWNPSHDVQSIFRIYRFGQKKPCYVYRLLAAGTMEEKIYNRQVTKLSLSCRVVDELQIERHYSNNDLAELYKFDPPGTNTPDLALPKDRLLAEIFLRHKNLVETFHEHDSLLENIAEEELDAEERKQAWQEYEDEKAGKPLVTPQMLNYQNQQQMMLMQQYNNQMMNSLNMSNPAKQVELSQLMSMFQQDYPHLTEHAQRGMALKALSNMYNYVENQVIGRGLNPSIMTNIANPSNPTATLANALAQQEYSRFHSGFNQQNLSPQQRQMLYAQSFGNVNSLGKNPQVPAGAVNPNASASKFSNNDDDIIEIPSSSSTRVGGVTQASSNSPKRQEE
ncbi:transcriptional regulator ATRX homolog [Microplitis mediator]|uniref:transcriptional regulator ATRX homolog n=1 Tax=Microplitis mediator TaxID=375433 RepID=UPI00255777F8|nr:transcriptional regulator ATRX homolog [Microplitis mediator]